MDLLKLKMRSKSIQLNIKVLWCGNLCNGKSIYLFLNFFYWCTLALEVEVFVAIPL